MSVSGHGPLEILVGPGQAHRRWQRLDSPQGVFVPVLFRGPGLCPQWFVLIHGPLPRPQPGQRLGTVPAFRAVSKPLPYWGPQGPPHQVHYSQSNKRWSGLGGYSRHQPHHQISNSHPTPRTYLFSSPSTSPMLTSPQLPLSPCCFSSAKLVRTSGPLTMLFPLPGMLFPPHLPPSSSSSSRSSLKCHLL